eukprot:351816-Chlamydomonas_euryale.AAC.8
MSASHAHYCQRNVSVVSSWDRLLWHRLVLKQLKLLPARACKQRIPPWMAHRTPHVPHPDCLFLGHPRCRSAFLRRHALAAMPSAAAKHGISNSLKELELLLDRLAHVRALGHVLVPALPRRRGVGGHCATGQDCAVQGSRESDGRNTRGGGAALWYRVERLSGWG